MFQHICVEISFCKTLQLKIDILQGKVISLLVQIVKLVKTKCWIDNVLINMFTILWFELPQMPL